MAASNPAAPASSAYLNSQTSALESQSPVPASQARAAQVPLQSFNLPTFPPEAFTSGLTALILTSDIKMDEYTDLLSKPFSVPDLPSSITSLTLELFSLGYPPSFLSSLGAKLPGLKSLTVYSQLLAGTSPQSTEDALSFISAQTGLQEVHLLDVFAPPGFFTNLAEAFTPALRFLEISFTYRHSDVHFLSSLPSKEIRALVRKGLVALTVGISAPDVKAEDEEDREGTEVGILAVGSSASKEVIGGLKEDGKGAGLVMLDLTMFELGVDDVREVLGACGKLKVLGLTVGLGDKDGWEGVLNALGEKMRGVEAVEIVGVPGEGLVEKVKGVEGNEDGWLTKEGVEKLGATCEGLKSVKVSVLRTKGESWTSGEDGVWEKSS